MQRKWAVRPDETGTVSREALYQAFADAVVVLDLCGGCLEAVVGREKTDVPGEMVMTGALLCWKDRTDAKPQAEVAQAVVPEPPKAEMVTGGTDLAAAEALAEDLATYNEIRVEVGSMAPGDGALVDPADGFDYTKLEAEDIENEPAAT